MDIFPTVAFEGVDLLYHEGSFYPSLNDIIENDLLLTPGYKRLAVKLKAYCEIAAKRIEAAASQKSFEDYI